MARLRGEAVASRASFVPDSGPGHWQAVIAEFLRRHVEAAGAKGVVVGVSGGLDSAVVAALAVAALGKRRVLAVMLPAPDSHALDAKHADLGCKTLGIKPLHFGIGPILAGADAALGKRPPARIRGNLKARSRMMMLYAVAQQRGMLVCGTGNKSEILTGYFTKNGDGGVDLQPIGDLYKTQVRELALHIKIPRPIIAKPPSAGLYAGQTDEGEMGLTYKELDAVLRGMELNLATAAIARRAEVSPATVRKVERMVRRSEHKRRPPLIPKIGARTVGIDWRRSVHWDG